MDRFFKSDATIFWCIYLLALAITLRYALFVFQITSDQELEYQLYLRMIERGGWYSESDNMLSACLVSNYFPSLIQRFTGIDAEFLFRIFPCFFFSFMPAFVYLIARKGMNKGYSLLVAGVILSNFYFLWYPAIGRVAVAWAVSAGLIWAVLSKRTVVAILFALLLVVSHYGTNIVILGALLSLWAFLLLAKRYNRFMITLSLILVIFATSTYIWHWRIAGISGSYVGSFVTNTIEDSTYSNDTLSPTQQDKDTNEGNTTNPVTKPAPSGEVVRRGATGTGEFWELSRREGVVRSAFGSDLSTMNVPQKIEFVMSWVLVAMVTLGLVLMLWRKQYSLEHRYLATAFWGLNILGVIVPYISVFYGIARVWFTGLIVLAPCFVIGSSELSQRLKLKGYVLPLATIGVYVLCVSGMMHWFWGIQK